MVTTPVIEIVGVAVMASVNVAVMVTVSEEASRLSASVSVSVTLTLELQTPHSGCFDVSALQELVPAEFIKLEGSLLILETHHPEIS